MPRPYTCEASATDGSGVYRQGRQVGLAAIFSASSGRLTWRCVNCKPIAAGSLPGTRGVGRVSLAAMNISAFSLPILATAVDTL
jgi:hypothetical protein